MKRKMKSLFVMLTLVVAMLTISATAFATSEAGGALGTSTLVTGTQKLISDVQTWLLVLAPVVGGVFIVYFAIRRSGADEQDQKRWNNRIVTAVVSTIGAVLAVGLLGTVLSYYV